METARYNYVRKELVNLHRIITEETFNIFIPLSSFMTLKQLETARDRPPLTGFETFEETIERPFSIQRMLTAVEIMGDELSIGFRHARRDIPYIYESIQNWIKYWIEIKIGFPHIRTAPIEELELIEKLAKHIFGSYAHYHYEKINKTLHIPDIAQASLLDILKGRMMYGSDIDEQLSFISHVDEYKALTGSRSSSNSMGGMFGGLGGL